MDSRPNMNSLKLFLLLFARSSQSNTQSLKVFHVVTDPFHSIEMTSPFVNLLEATAAPVSRSRMMIVSSTPALP